MAGRTARRPARATWATTAAASVGALVGGLLLAACGGSTELDRATVEEEVALVLAPVAGPGIDRVTCPDRIERAEGATVTCTVELSEGLGAFDATVRQVDGDGELEVEAASVAVEVAEVEAELAELLEDELDRVAEVVCGRGEHRLVAVGATFPCRVEDGDEQRSVDVTIEDGAGTRSYEVLPAR
jgi:hypothetical protein